MVLLLRGCDDRERSKGSRGCDVSTSGVVLLLARFDDREKRQIDRERLRWCYKGINAVVTAAAIHPRPVYAQINSTFKPT